MPEEIELNRERRKQLAEFTLEYPTKIEEEENPTQQHEEEKDIIPVWTVESPSAQ